MDQHRHPVSPVDVTWLHMDSETNPMVITAMLGLDGPVQPAALDELVARITAFPRFRQRIVSSGLGASWEDDPRFDPLLHVHRVALPSPGGAVALAELVSDVMSSPLDHTRPLWQLHVIEGVEPPVGHGVALLARVHHALGDGFALVRMLLSLVGLDTLLPDVGLPPPPPAAHLGDLAVRAAKGVVALGRLLVAPYDESTPLTGPQSRGKRIAWSSAIPLARVKDIARAAGAKTNDVLMASVTGAVRTYLLRHGGLHEGLELHAIVPVLLRGKTDDPALGNHFGFVLPALPVTTTSPIDRVHAMKRTMDAVKASAEASVSFGIVGAEGFAGVTIERFLADWYTRKGSLLVTNVAGPPLPIELAGRVVESIAVFPPTAGRVSLGVSLLSYAGAVRMAVTSDVALMPSPEWITTAFEEDLVELGKACLSGGS